MASRVEIVLQGYVGSGNWAITSNWALASAPSVSQMQLAMNTLGTSLNSSTGTGGDFTKSIGTQYHGQNLHALTYPSVAPPATFATDAKASFNGQAAHVCQPVPLATVVSERTAGAGPSYRGRTYWPYAYCGPDGVYPNDADTAIVRTGWLAYNALVTAAFAGQGLTATQVVYSRKLGSMTPIVIIGTGNRIDTSRGRFTDDRETYVNQTLPGTVEVEPENIGPAAVADPDSFDEEVLEAWNRLKSSGPTWQEVAAFGGDVLPTLLRVKPVIP